MIKATSLGILLVLTGCATIVTGTDQEVAINTPGHDGARCILTSEGIGEHIVTTPASIKLSRSKHDIQVNCTKACFAGSSTISSNFEGMTAGNIVLGGVIGLGVDSASGALNKYTPSIAVPMTRKQECRA